MSDAINRIRSEINALTPEEREQLSAALAYESSRSEISLTREEQTILDAIRRITRSQRPTAMLIRDYGSAKFKSRCAEIMEFIASSRKLLRPPQIAGLIDRCLDCLASDLRSREIPVTPGTLLNSTGMLRHALDQRFPGYAEAGHLHRLVDSAA